MDEPPVSETPAPSAPKAPIESSEETLVLDALEAGDSAALGEFLSREEPRLRRIAATRLDPRLAGRVGPDDVLQEAFLDVSRRLEEYLEQRRSGAPQRLPLFLWVRLMTKQVIARLHREHLGSLKRDAGREQRSAGSSSGTSLGSTTVILAHQLRSHHTTPTGALHRLERQEAFEAALERLGDDDREIIILRHYEELSNSEIARVLGLTESGASMRHLRALSRLKEITSAFDPNA